MVSTHWVLYNTAVAASGVRYDVSARYNYVAGAASLLITYYYVRWS